MCRYLWCQDLEMVRFTNPEEVLMALGLTQEMLADQLHITGDSFNELRSDPLTRRWKCSPMQNGC